MNTAAKTIINQAEKLGYDVDVDEASYTNSVYITVSHPQLGDDDRLVRVSDHDGNDARYAAGMNREPDLSVEFGFQVAAVEQMAEWVGVDPATLPYIKAARTREAKQQQAKADIDAKVEAAAVERSRRWGVAMANLSDESRAVMAEYATTTGKRRKHVRKTGRYRRAKAELDRLYEEA